MKHLVKLYTGKTAGAKIFNGDGEIGLSGMILKKWIMYMMMRASAVPRRSSTQCVLLGVASDLGCLQMLLCAIAPFVISFSVI